MTRGSTRGPGWWARVGDWGRGTWQRTSRLRAGAGAAARISGMVVGAARGVDVPPPTSADVARQTSAGVVREVDRTAATRLFDYSQVEVNRRRNGARMTPVDGASAARPAAQQAAVKRRTQAALERARTGAGADSRAKGRGSSKGQGQGQARGAGGPGGPGGAGGRGR